MYSESVCHVERGWKDEVSFQTRLVVRFIKLTPSIRNILDTPSHLCCCNHYQGFDLSVVYLKMG
jgi:hypothetical protein